MWEQVFAATVEVPIEYLWAATSDVPAWPTWDQEIAEVQPLGLPAVGERFVVHDACGRHAQSTVEECSAPHRFAYATPLFLALLRTQFEFEPAPSGTRVQISIRVSGLLGPIWRHVLRGTRSGSLADRAGRLVRRARELSRKNPVPASSGDSPFRPAPEPALGIRQRPAEESIRSHSPTLQARHLTCAFRDGEQRKVVLNDVSLDLHSGELALLTGPSRSGKTTLLAVLSGLRKPDGGQVRTFGRDLGTLSEDELAEFRRQHCGFLFQGSNLLPDLTVRQQLEIVLFWAGVTGRQARHRADEILALIGLTEKAGFRPDMLSSGEGRRVALGRALVKGSDLVFADEPTSALDWETGWEMIGLLREYAHECGATILVTSHDPRAEPNADQEFHLDAGMLEGAGGVAGGLQEDGPWVKTFARTGQETGVQR